MDTYLLETKIDQSEYSWLQKNQYSRRQDLLIEIVMKSTVRTFWFSFGWCYKLFLEKRANLAKKNRLYKT